MTSHGKLEAIAGMKAKMVNKGQGLSAHEKIVNRAVQALSTNNNFHVSLFKKLSPRDSQKTLKHKQSMCMPSTAKD